MESTDAALEDESVANPQQLERRSVLTIAGSDSGGGAGIQADLRTIAAHGLHPLTAITALTAQHTRGVTAIHPCPLPVLRAQIDAAFEDFEVGAVKIGMLANAEVIAAVAQALRAHRPAAVVLDPVMVASSGAPLLEADAMAALLDKLLPLATVITPNLPEAELLTGMPIADRPAMAVASARLRALGARAVLLKGGHLQAEQLTDRFEDDAGAVEWTHPRLPVEGHGTGCTLSSALASRLAQGAPLVEACRLACDYVHGALRHGYRPGRSTLTVLVHDWQGRPRLD